MKNQNITKNQHYIPEALLWNFAEPNGRIYEALLGTNMQYHKIFPTGPDSSMCEKFVYEDNNLKVNTVEKYFSRIESEIIPLVKNLIECIFKHKDGKVSFADIKKAVDFLLPIFIVFYYRSGALLAEFSSIDRKDKIPSLSKKILNHEYIQLLSETIKKGYRFGIVESTNDFLLSDQFVSTAALKVKSRFFDISNRHIGLKETIILIPISSSYYGVYWHTNDNFIIDCDKINLLNDEYIKLFNKTIINNSYLKCVGQKEERIKEVISDYRWAAPSHIYAGGNPSGYFTGAIKKKEVFFYEDEGKVFEMIEFSSFAKFKNLGRNDLCACASGKKFKKCHGDTYERFKLIMQSFGRSARESRNEFCIHDALVTELPVDNWSGFSKKNNETPSA